MLAEILKRLVESGIGIVSFREKEGNLEEIFMQVTGGAGVMMNPVCARSQLPPCEAGKLMEHWCCFW